jgi:hypothetical protein
MSWLNSLLSVCLASLLSILLAEGQLAAQQVINTVPAFLPGQQVTLQLVQSSEDVRDNPPKKVYETPVSLRVIRRSTEGTFLDWVAGKSSGSSAAQRSDPVLKMAESIFENLHLMVQLDAAGKYQGIRNEEELRAKIQEFELLLIPQTTAKILDPAERRRVADVMAKVMTPQAMLSAARKEIDLYFGLSGLPLEVGKSLRIKSSVINPFGEKGTLDGEMEITPAEIDSVKGEARIEFHQEFDPKTVAGPALGNNLVSGPESAAAVSGLTLVDSGEYVLDLTSGRVKQVQHVRTIRQNGEPVRVETTEITVR